MYSLQKQCISFVDLTPKVIKQQIDKGIEKSVFASWDLFFCWMLSDAKQAAMFSLFVLGILSVLNVVLF